MKQNRSSVMPSVRFLLKYVFRNRGLAILCTVCVVLNSLANIAAPYLLRPIINVYIRIHITTLAYSVLNKLLKFFIHILPCGVFLPFFFCKSP